MVKPFTCYATGLLTTALAVSMGCGRWGAICYALGLMSFPLVAVIALRWGWLRARLARMLVGGANQRVKRPACSSAPKTRVDGFDIRKSVALGLKGLGCDSERARWAAAQAARKLPTGSETEVLKLAIQMAGSR